MTNLRKRLRSSEGKDRAQISGTGTGPSQSLLSPQGLPLQKHSRSTGERLRDALSIPGGSRQDDPSQLPGEYLVSIPRVQGSGHPIPWPTLLHMKSRKGLKSLTAGEVVKCLQEVLDTGVIGGKVLKCDCNEEHATASLETPSKAN